MSRTRLVAIVGLTLLAFASNSLLARAAIERHGTDPATFTLVRVASGAAMLAALVWARGHGARGGSWAGALALFAYAIAFSAAYVRIQAGMGALLLFGAVQVTMIGWGLAQGERPAGWQWAGLAVALGGLVLLTRPGGGAPEPIGAAAMLVAGVAWGIYSLLGRAVRAPLPATADNFIRAVLPALAVLGLQRAVAGGLDASATGLLLAGISGAAASGLGYTLWYAVLPHLARVQAAVVQLAVPVIAAAGAVLLLDEPVTARLVLSSAAILGGVAFAVTR